jgi:hypothetical protein
VNNAIVYRGPSLITGDPIVVAITGLAGTSINPKTGPMAQAWVLRADMNPIVAVNTGADEAICGNCKMRTGTNKGRACYVIWWQAPHNVFRRLPLYPDMHPRDVAPHIMPHGIRIAAYGDPAAVPTSVWLDLLSADVTRWTGYTHQWRDCDPAMSAFLMASVDSEREAHEAATRGWRTFRVRTDKALWTSPVKPHEVICPASDEGGHRTTCQRCGLCKGNANMAKSVVIMAHGQRAGLFPSAEKA